jgi:hypothetical protein
MTELKFWIEGGVVRMTDAKYDFSALGAYSCGYSLERLEWAIATVEEPTELAQFFGKLRFCERIRSFEDIGSEAKYYHDMLSNYTKSKVSTQTKDILRDARAKWDTLMRERLQDRYLVTPISTINPKKLMRGIEGFLNPELFSMLEAIEASDLNEACRCILIGSATAAEHIALRAAESLLRRWYECKTGDKLSRGTWGTVLDRLVQTYPEKSRPKEINLLGYLKQRRDEVAHPDRVSKLAEAETTLMNVCSLHAGIQLSIQPNLAPEEKVRTTKNESVEKE